MNPLYGAEAISLSCALYDASQELQIITQIIPKERVSKFDLKGILNKDIRKLIESQGQLESNFERVLEGYVAKSAERKAETLQETRNIAHTLKDGVNSNAYQNKMRADCQFLSELLACSAVEIGNSGTLNSLEESVDAEMKKKDQINDIVKREEASHARARQLKKQIEAVKKNEVEAIEDRKDMIAHLKDQLQELKSKVCMESKYMKNCAEVNIANTVAQYSDQEKAVANEIDRVSRILDEEVRVNAETQSYLRGELAELQNMNTYWTEKYQQQSAEMKKRLEDLQATRAKDLQSLQDLTTRYHNCEKVVLEDRLEKEKERLKAEYAKREMASAALIQNWWRTVLVRKQLGPYGKKKKKKKGGKKGGKKKK